MSRILQEIKKHNQTFEQYLVGKSVAIVGPASSVMYEKNGKEINDYDIIVRINRGYENIEDKKEYIGNRTDILYNSLDMSPLCGGPLVIPEKYDIKYICCPYPIQEKTFSNHIFYKNKHLSLFEKYKIRFILLEILYNID